MRLRRVLKRGRPVGDVGVACDERWPFVGVGGEDRFVDGWSVVSVHVQRVPTERTEPGEHVLGEGDIGVATDGDPVVVVEIGEPVESQPSRQRSRLRGDPSMRSPSLTNA